MAQDLKHQSLIPVAMGNRWEYRESELREDGTVASTRPTSEVIRSFYDSPRGRFFYLEATDYCMWLRDTARGLEDVMMAVDEETMTLKFDGKPGVYYRYPVEEGQTYLVDYETEFMPVTVMTVLELKAKVQVPAGEFTCIKYQSLDKETRLPESMHYVCPGVGLVKYETYEEGKLVTNSELTKYQLKKEAISDSPRMINAIMPIALGNSWTYRGTSVDADGTTVAEGPSRDVIRGMYESEAGSLYYLESDDFGLWIQNTPQGNQDVEIVLDDETSHLKMVGKPTMYYRYPAKPGTTYDLLYGGLEEDEAYSTITVAALEEEVTVPAGIFICVRYESHIKETGELERVEFVSPGTGLVKTEEYLDDKLTYTSVLTRYNIRN
ncbi:MAG: hypothetical protein HUJ26_06810 [Planctomycetaceae bacterium]|nr:hypothetical protein [Planctomycetaceae bacterium]